MFCPNCKAEYREGFFTCSDCCLELVDMLPPGQEPEFIEYAEILGTYNSGDIALIKSILDSEEITYYFNAEHFMFVRPLSEPVRLMVKADEAPKARQMLQGLNLAITGFNLRKKSGRAKTQAGK